MAEMETQTEAQKTLIIGDVGSGKTVVAMAILTTYLQSLGSGRAALMAPTSVLAKQHYQSIYTFLSLFTTDFDVVLYTQGEYYLNNQKLTKNKLLKSDLQAKQIWVGTQALLYLDSEYSDWGLVVVDEQHRFGVKQRSALASSISSKAHFVSLTATPIPRSLALSLYTDLEVYYLESFRNKNIQTKLIGREDWLSRVRPKIQTRLQQQEKVYIVCPKVGESSSDEMFSLDKVYKTLKAEFGETCLKVHGREKAKLDILKQFKEDSSKNILVSTSVIEVGVDVEQASMMVILDAHSFGLAALHQIRGRIGRNNLTNNVCFLVSDFVYSKRLQTLVNTLDGFEIAKKDLEIRGKGSLYGEQQSGYDPEVELLMNLPNSQRNNLLTMVDSLDFTKLASELPRLDTYLKQSLAEFWQE